MILIQENPNLAGFFELITPKGQSIEVNTRNGQVTVYIQQKGSRRLPYGRTFPNLAKAMAAYKSADVKAALYALAEA